MAICYDPSFDREKWDEKYYRATNELLNLYSRNPQLNIGHLHTLILIVEKVAGMLDEDFQLRQRVEQINAELRKQ